MKSYALFRKNANIRLPKPYLEAKTKASYMDTAFLVSNFLGGPTWQLI